MRMHELEFNKKLLHTPVKSFPSGGHTAQHKLKKEKFNGNLFLTWVRSMGSQQVSAR